MCTAAVYKTKDFYFGRNLDYDFRTGRRLQSYPGIIRSISVSLVRWSIIMP